jgi:hypothetical protein
LALPAGRGILVGAVLILRLVFWASFSTRKSARTRRASVAGLRAVLPSRQRQMGETNPATISPASRPAANAAGARDQGGKIAEMANKLHD